MVVVAGQPAGPGRRCCVGHHQQVPAGCDPARLQRAGSWLRSSVTGDCRKQALTRSNSDVGSPVAEVGGHQVQPLRPGFRRPTAAVPRAFDGSGGDVDGRHVPALLREPERVAALAAAQVERTSRRESGGHLGEDLVHLSRPDLLRLGVPRLPEQRRIVVGRILMVAWVVRYRHACHRMARGATGLGAKIPRAAFHRFATRPPGAGSRMQTGPPVVAAPRRLNVEAARVEHNVNA